MALIKQPVTGMKDVLPAEMELRNYVMGVIRDTYAGFGFTAMETPCVESLANLSSRQGGENEKLIFKIMKRGEKLRIADAKSEDDLADYGLRYDLTVPLVRYYANHMNELPSPFKALQMGYVYRADRPQKGRYRQFMQCDIDILGEAGNIAEIELILALTTTMGRLGFKGFQIRINDRRILKAMAGYSGFPEESYDEVFIILDKMDKIGIDGVAGELEKAGYAKESIDRYLPLFEEIREDHSVAGMRRLCDTLGDFLAPEIRESMEEIMNSVEATKEAEFETVFDPTLVRGMSYYTGTIFEVAMPQYGGSCGGGGRYDKMVGRFTGQDTPAVGFSIGFERIIMLLMEQGFQVPGSARRVAFLLERGIHGDAFCGIIARAQEERAKGAQVLVVHMNKNRKFQKEQLTAQGYTELREFYRERERRS